MKLHKLSKEFLQKFKDYCKTYGKVHDDSYLYEEDMRDEDFLNEKENPTIIMVKDDEVVGVASLMLNINFGKGNEKYRFRIFHVIDGTFEVYKVLLDELIKTGINYDELFMFVPLKIHKNGMSDILGGLGFEVERYAFLMERMNEEFIEPILPDGFRVTSLDLENELQIWIDIKNESFKKLAGVAKRDVPFLQKYIDSPEYIEDGLMLLWKEDEPIGVLSIARDDEDGINEAGVDAIGVLPGYQGLGLGRELLRTGIKFAIQKGFKKIWLSVHGENEKATKLYSQEGFTNKMELVCHKLVK